jgi:hypothetical protein
VLLERHQERRREYQCQETGNPELVQPVLHGVSAPFCDENPALQIPPVRNLLKGSISRFFFGQSFFAKCFARFFQVRGELRMNFVFLGGLKRKIGETLAD